MQIEVALDLSPFSNFHIGRHETYLKKTIEKFKVAVRATGSYIVHNFPALAPNIGI